ncbi:PqqD family peptide modification chaperone [Pseudooceanicola sp. CBS1P-1]|uniref:PqqD family peptide modification chaperone n=1 Tax=Pseudooceanicola albus TaxID=2692189 RepID=A0A6L7G8S1_9RHOB|nr:MULTISPECIES: PqqD family peptide modification chaperone [Pseudooceanicola]MBT9384344.1 PqqD family peptide modification chaperone [Pseudooceanicola endophyticus]MXN19918.1 PqqD family peptide modification chaperone [Pseudooceanicola albus]
MAQAFLSQDWYRVAPLKPRLRPHVEIHRQRFRGATWFVVQDSHSGRYHRLSPAANLMLSLMDGRRTVQSLWEAACARFDEDPPTQAEVIRLLAQLHGSDLIAGDMAPDIAEMGRRHHDQSRSALMARLRNPLALRLPLFDPDVFLDRTVFLVRPLFTLWGFLAWAALVITGVTLAVLHGSELLGGVIDRVLSAENLVLIALAFPLVKAIHEMGHAYATKVWGGEVHEIGTMFLVFVPVPYVDASASAAFPEKWRRAVVGGAGIMVELALAAIAMIVWINVEPGLVRAFTFNVMLIGGVSTLLFNGNPLLRFDGYFVLTDIVEIPNLGQRASGHFWYLVQRHLLGIRSAESPVTARGEAKWFLFYAVAAFCYRISISVTIALVVASKFFFIGVLLAVWALANVFLVPAWKGLKFLVTSGSLRGRRGRAFAVAGTALALVAAAVFALPVPHRTLAPGVVWLQDDQILRAATDGFVAEAPVTEAAVSAGTLLLRLEDPILSSERRLAEARLAEMRLKLAGVAGRDAVQARLLREQVLHLEGQLDLLRTRAEALRITAPRDGMAMIPGAEDLPGRMLRKGAVLGYLVPQGARRYRVAVPQQTAELVRASDRISLRLERAPGQEIPARLLAFAPEGTMQLPSGALSTNAGGPFATDPADPEGRRTVQRLFLFDIAPLDATGLPFVGERVRVRFDHGDEPVGPRMGRALRQLFLKRFHV